MEYQVALSPDLGLSAEDFVNAWNEDEEARAVAEAQSVPYSSTYEPISTAVLIGIGVGVASSIGMNVASSAIYDLIKHVLTKRLHKPVKVTDVSGPDSPSKQIVVTEAEKK